MDTEIKTYVHCAALAHQNDFDVCWARGNVSEVIFAPLVSILALLHVLVCVFICALGDGRFVVTPQNVSNFLCLWQVDRIERAGGSIVGGRLVSDLRLDPATGAVNAVVSRDREGNQTVHQADAVVFAIGITGVDLARLRGSLVSCTLRSNEVMLPHPGVGLCM